MSIEDSDAALRIVEAGRRRVLTRMRDAFAHQAANHGDLGEIDPAVLDRLVHEATEQAGASVWRIALAEGAGDEYGVGIAEALAHPAVAAAEQLVGPSELPGVPPGATASGPPAADAPEPPEPPAPPAAPEDAPPAAQSEPDMYDPWGLGESGDEAAADQAPPAPAADSGYDSDSESGYERGDGYEADSASGYSPDPAPEPDLAPEPEPAPDPEPASTEYGAQSEPPTAVHQAAPEPDAPEPAPAPEPSEAPAAAGASAGAGEGEGEGEAPQALRIPAVHTSGIETLKQGDKDLELRLSDAGLDVLRHSTGVAIGRLDWGEITAVEIEAVKKGLRGRKVSQSLQVKTSRGQATFELPGLSEEESSVHLQPMLDRLRTSGMLAGGSD